jgi:Integrase core domain
MVPGAISTCVSGVNDRGDLIGTYEVLNDGRVYAFVQRHGEFTPIEIRNAESVFPLNINKRAVVVGYYQQVCAAARPASGRRWARSATAMTMRCARASFATLECELLDRVRLRTPREARLAVFHFIEGWYNPRRRHSALDYASPLAFEHQHAPPAPETVVAESNLVCNSPQSCGSCRSCGTHRTRPQPLENHRAGFPLLPQGPILVMTEEENRKR